jgi:4-hydroxybenzoate polyprenyltransferase
MTTLSRRNFSGRVVLLARDIKLSHSVFALPFALLAAFLAAAHRGELPGVLTLGLIVLCMVLARTAAMAMNRWADAHLDAANPRTAGRAIPSGGLSSGFVLGAIILCGLGFISASSGFWLLNGNFWPVTLSPLVLAWLLAYSFTKRFTWLCHLFLGSALALSPLAAALAVEPSYLATPDPYLLFVMVMSWVAGFDILYALQDVEVDRGAKLFSIPSRLGENTALALSRLLHAISLTCLIYLTRISDQLAVCFGVGVAIVGLLLVLEHALVWRSRTHRINVAFLTVNGVISLLLGALGILDVVLSLRHASPG